MHIYIHIIHTYIHVHRRGRVSARTHKTSTLPNTIPPTSSPQHHIIRLVVDKSGFIKNSSRGWKIPSAAVGELWCRKNVQLPYNKMQWFYDTVQIAVCVVEPLHFARTVIVHAFCVYQVRYKTRDSL